MLCRKPYMAGGIPFGCGQCLPCRINRRRQWMWRQYLESLCHEHNAFVTLTYDTAHIPGNWQLEKRALQLFFKSLRFAIQPHRIRYFAVGEYGEKNQRPHYHISLFGVSGHNLFHGKPIAEYRFNDRTGNIDTVGGWVHECWGRGLVDVKEFNHLTAQYVAGYVTKKLTDYRDGRDFNVPEFAIMSTRPGIGANAASQIARDLASNPSWERANDDVPRQLKIGGRTIPMGRYLLRKCREELGFTEDYINFLKDRVSYDRSIDMLALLANSPSNSTFKAAYLSDIEGQLLQVEARAEIFKKRDTL